MYLCADHWENQNIESNIQFMTGTPSLFVNPYYSKALQGIARSYDI